MSHCSILETKVGNDKFMEPGKLQILRTNCNLSQKGDLKVIN